MARHFDMAGCQSFTSTVELVVLQFVAQCMHSKVLCTFVYLCRDGTESKKGSDDFKHVGALHTLHICLLSEVVVWMGW